MLLTANIFQPLIDVFESVLKFFHNSVGVPWGWSIVLLTVVIRAILIPLTLKQFGSMQKLQRLGPEIKAIQAKYKDDKQRQQQEVMKFYKENNVNPLGSCLPLVAQLPVFISLFYMLRQSLRIDICPAIQHKFQAAYQSLHGVSAMWPRVTTPCGVGRGAGFLFINDLTNKATGATLVGAGRALRRHAAGIGPDDVDGDDGAHAASADAVHAADLRAVHHQLPGRRDRLLDHHQLMDDGPAVHRQAPARADDPTGRCHRGAAANVPVNRGQGDGLQRRIWVRRRAGRRFCAANPKTDEPPVGVGSRQRDGKPPPPPRKKKRSGRRR